VITALALAFVLEAGATHFQTHANGVWFQEGLPYALRTTSPTLGLGVREGPWTIGATYLGKVESKALATVRDVDYDPVSKRCLDRCDALATFTGRGDVWGVYLRRLNHTKFAQIEIGLLAFRPRWDISVSNFRPDGLLTNAVHAETYKHKPKWQLAPSLGIKQGNWTVRVHLGIKARGDWITALYNGAATSLTYEF
jgi:hypothetical protein